MRLRNDAKACFLAIGGVFGLTGCGFGGGDYLEVRTAGDEAPLAASERTVLGEPFTVDGEVYTPADTMNYDALGYAALDRQASGVSIAHKTLPLPSYVEITSLTDGRTILARVDRRGPMTSERLAGLSPAAAQQLGVADGAAIRIRRVFPTDVEQAMLRQGGSAPARLETPKALLAVLSEKLPASGWADIAGPRQAGSAPEPRPDPVPTVAAAPARPVNAPTQSVAAEADTARSFDRAFPSTPERQANSDYPLRPLREVPLTPRSPSQYAPLAIETSEARPRSAAPASPSATVRSAAPGNFVVQAAAFSNRANADRAAKVIGGFVERSGTYFRVRTGPFANRGQAEAALAKVRAAGYSDAKVFTTG
ncbi:SPOR domain-containing protein [Qipengyuania sp. JC766]|uniref:SPOR domain-containing protein n=1 Tax=Qipengyuania sp. JC766 TaxID=3232139 RepID=UPI003457BB3A